MPKGAFFGAVPARASRDKRLCASDFRLLTAIATFDQFNKNGRGCYVAARILSEECGIDYSHLARHTQRLADFGYIEVMVSVKDRRKRIYRVIYDNPAEEKVATGGDNLPKEVANGGDKTPEKVANAKSQGIDAPKKSGPIRYTLKEKKKAAGNQKSARQGKPGTGGAPPQRELRVFGDVNQKLYQGRRSQDMSPLNEAAQRLGNDLLQKGYYDTVMKALKGADQDPRYKEAVKREFANRGTAADWLFDRVTKDAVAA